MTSCQGLVPADLKPNHLAKWILPLDKRGMLFFRIPTFFSYLLFFFFFFPPNRERGPGSGSPLDEVLLCMAGDNREI